MRNKKDLLSGIYNIYAVLDNVSKHYKGIYFATTDEEFCRLYLPSCISKYPLRDLSVFRVAQFNDVTGDISKAVRKRVNLECYKFPHSKLSPIGENIKLSEIEETIQKTKNAILAGLSESDIEGEKHE